MTQDSMAEMLSALGVDESRIRLLSEFVAKSQPKHSQDEKFDRLRRSLERVQQVLGKHHAITEENVFLRERLETLAAALGACSECWGEYAACAECGGDGRPGFYRPDPTAFSAFVLPAVRAAQLSRRRRAARPERETAPVAASQSESATSGT